MPRFAECDAVHWTETKLYEDAAPAGAFAYFGSFANPAGLHYKCPCGCGSIGTLRFRTSDTSRPSWIWTGTRDAPTLKPSVNSLDGPKDDPETKSHWHGWLTDGKWISA